MINTKECQTWQDELEDVRSLLLVGPRCWVPLFEFDELSEVAEDRHEADNAEVERGQEAKCNDAERMGEVRPVPERDADGDEQADKVDTQSPHGEGEATKVAEPFSQTLMREAEDERGDEDKEKLCVDVEVGLSIDQELEKTNTRPPTVVVRICSSTYGRQSVSEGDLGPALCPSHALLGQCRYCLWGKLVGKHLEIILDPCARDDRTHGTVNVFSEHVLLHTERFKE